MKANFTIEYNDLKRAINNHPRKLRMSVNNFLVRASASYRRAINQTTWTTRSSGGGVPKDTQNLRMAHEYTIRPFSLVVSVNENKAPYAKYVHGYMSNGNRSVKVKGKNLRTRPWLLDTQEKKRTEIKLHERRLLKEITNALGK